MILLKIFLSYIPLFFLFFYILIISNSPVINNPNSSLNQKVQDLNTAISLANLKFSIMEINPQLNEIYLKHNQTTAYISLNSDVYTQVATLQNIIKNANIKNKVVELIDLTTTNPYATFKNR